MIDVSNLSMQYRSHRHSRSTFKKKFLSFFYSRFAEDDSKIDVLKNLSFTVNQGDFLGVLGPNGTGKTTLLHIIAGTVKPTQGNVIIQGKIAPMIEIGLGFNPDLTGTENIFLNASLYGLNKKEIRTIFNSIVDFSELHDFMNTPIRYYSSGMVARLAFSISVYLEADILLIDEFMAVGDAYFTQKCIQKMLEIKKKGVTAVFVSHNIEMVRMVCNQAALLTGGRFIIRGDVEPVIKRYYDFL